MLARETLHVTPRLERQLHCTSVAYFVRRLPLKSMLRCSCSTGDARRGDGSQLLIPLGGELPADVLLPPRRQKVRSYRGRGHRGDASPASQRQCQSAGCGVWAGAIALQARMVGAGEGVACYKAARRTMCQASREDTAIRACYMSLRGADSGKTALQTGR